MEPLLARIRRDIEGIRVFYPGVTFPRGTSPPSAVTHHHPLKRRQTHFILNVFADDLIVGCTDEGDLQRLNAALRTYENASNARRHTGKSFLIPVGEAQKEPPDRLLDWPVKPGNFRYLGIQVGYEDASGTVWDDLLERASTRLSHMILTGLPYHIKARIINTYAFSKARFLLLHLPPPVHGTHLQRLRDLGIKALNRGAPASGRVATALCVPRQKGGTGLLDPVRDMAAATGQRWHEILTAAESEEAEIPLHVLLTRHKLHLQTFREDRGRTGQEGWARMAVRGKAPGGFFFRHNSR
jgi:hypothetical protein